MNLSQKLKKWRASDKAGPGKLTQLGAARKLGVPLSTYIKWESGQATPRGLGLGALLERIK